MKLLIFFLIFFLLFTPTVIAEETYIPLKVQLVDLSESKVSGIMFVLYNDDRSNEIGRGMVDENGILKNFGVTKNTKDSKVLGYLVELDLFYYSGTNYSDPLNIGRPIEIVGGSKRYFENNSLNYTIVINELNGKPAAIRLYNMTDISLNLAKQSKETSDKSYKLARNAQVFAIISLILSILSVYHNKLIIYQDTISFYHRIKNFILKNNYTTSQLKIFTIFVFFLCFTALVTIRSIFTPKTDISDVWIIDILIYAFFSSILAIIASMKNRK